MRNLIDPYLASVYGTQDTIEKIAGIDAIHKLAEGLPEHISASVSGLTDDQLEEIAREQMEIASQESDVSEDYSPEQIKQASDMFEVMDYGGRVLAHSMFREWGNIMKEASFGSDAGSIAHSLGSLGKHHAGKAVDAVGGAARRGASAVSGAAKSYKHHLMGGREIGTSEGVKRVGNTSAGLLNKATRGDALKSHGARAGTALAIGGAGMGAHHAMSKEASAFDSYARQYAMNLLEQSGYDSAPFVSHIEAVDSQGQNPGMQNAGQGAMNQRSPQPQAQATQPQMDDMSTPTQSPQEKMANDVMAQFNDALHQRALSMLAEAGYPVEDQDPMIADQDMQGSMQGAPGIQ